MAESIASSTSTPLRLEGMPLFPNETSNSSSSWVFAHCDGGSRGNPGPSGYGAVVTDQNGATLAELSEFLGVRTNNYAEYSGLLAVLAWALETGHERVKLVSDSELMVKQIQGKYKVNSPDLKPLWQEARDRIAKLKGFEISHALRHKNKEADALANEAMDRGMKRGGTGGAVESLPLRPRVGAAVSSPAGAASRGALPVRAPSAPAAPAMLRGFTKDGEIHLLGGATLPDGVFVKIIRE
jgi:probable phosphoglycerate mutase